MMELADLEIQKGSSKGGVQQMSMYRESFS